MKFELRNAAQVRTSEAWAAGFWVLGFQMDPQEQPCTGGRTISRAIVLTKEHLHAYVEVYTLTPRTDHTVASYSNSINLHLSLQLLLWGRV